MIFSKKSLLSLCMLTAVVSGIELSALDRAVTKEESQEQTQQQTEATVTEPQQDDGFFQKALLAGGVAAGLLSYAVYRIFFKKSEKPVLPTIASISTKPLQPTITLPSTGLHAHHAASSCKQCPVDPARCAVVGLAALGLITLIFHAR